MIYVTEQCKHDASKSTKNSFNSKSSLFATKFLAPMTSFLVNVFEFGLQRKKLRAVYRVSMTEVCIIKALGLLWGSNML